MPQHGAAYTIYATAQQSKRRTNVKPFGRLKKRENRSTAATEDFALKAICKYHLVNG